MMRLFIMEMQMKDLSITFIMKMENAFIVCVTPNNEITVLVFFILNESDGLMV